MLLDLRQLTLGIVLTSCGLCAAQSFQFEATTPSVALGTQSVTVVMTLSDEGSPQAEVVGWIMAMSHDPQQVELISINIDATLRGDPFFACPALYDDGWTVGVLFSSGGMSEQIGDPREAVQVTYELVGNPPLGTVVPLQWGVVGPLQVDNSVLLQGLPTIVPTLIDGSISIGS